MTAITHLDLTGFEQIDQLAWRDGQGTVMSLHFFNLRPDLPAPLHEAAALQAGLARHTAGRARGSSTRRSSRSTACRRCGSC